MLQPLFIIEKACVNIPGFPKNPPILDGIDWHARPLAHTAIAGRNGSGKSTLLRFLHGELPPCAGRIFWDDNGVRSQSRIAAQAMSTLVSPHLQADCQAYGWNARVRDILADPNASIAGARCESPQDFEPAACLLADLHSLCLADKILPELSQGQLRLVLLARALLKKPRLLLLDEWDSGLDAQHVQAMRDILARYADHVTMIFTGHRETSFPDWIVERKFLQNGRLLDCDAVKKETAHKRVSTGGASSENSIAGVGDPVFSLKHVSVFLDREQILFDINWQTRWGEHWRIEGENGSGKSTLLRLLAGREFTAFGGDFRHFSAKFGRPTRSLAEKNATIALISDLGEAVYGYPLTCLEAVLSGLDGAEGKWREYTPREINGARELLALFFAGSAHMEDLSIRALSSGQLRRVFLARALIAKPEVLLLDEPCAGLDEENRLAFMDLLEALAKGRIWEPAPQIILVSHYGEDMPAFINRRAVMKNGRLDCVGALMAP